MILKFQNIGLIKSGIALSGIKGPTPPGPVLPPFTIRVKFSQGYTPTMGETQTLVDAEENIWDITKNNTNWSYLLYSSNYDADSEVLEVLAANTTGVTKMSRMFYECTKLTTVALFDTSSVTTMEGMFRDCRSLTTVPLFNTSNVTSMYFMFSGCRSLTAVPLFNTSNVTTMDSMFNSCRSLTTVPLFDTSNVKNMNIMFGGCSGLTTIPLFNTSKVTGMEYMFYNCKNVQSGALALYQQASSQSTVPEHNGTFYECGTNTTTGAAELAQIPLDWKTEYYDDYEG